MKKITLFIFLMMLSFGYSQTDVIENFDGATQPSYAPDNGECTAIGTTTSTTQSASAPNSFEIVSQAAGNPWQGAQLILQGDMDLTTNLAVTVDVYSTVAAGILAKATNGTGPDSASAANHTGSGWETLTYNFADGADNTVTANGQYSVLRFYPLWGTAGGYAGQGTAGCVSDAPITIYVDNVMGTAPAVPTCTDGVENGDETGVDCGGANCAPCPPPPASECIVNFETNLPTISLGGNLGSATVVADPGTGDNNDVLQVVSAAAGDPWQSADLLLQGNTIDLTTDKTVTVEIYSTTPINILSKVITGGPDSATDALHGGAGWESLVFDFANPKDNTAAADGAYSVISFFPGWVGNGAGNNTTNADWNDPVDGTTFYVNCITAVPGTPTPAPANDDCGAATGIALATSVPFDSTGATDSGVATCYTGSVRDVWYSFTAPASGEVTITVGAGTQYALFSDCTTEEVSCNTDVNLVTTGSTYYVSVTDDGTNKVPGASTVQVDETMTLSNEEFETISFSVYPNPTNSDWNIKGTKEINSVQVYDILGKQVMSLNPNANELTISSTSLNSGLYFAKINSNSGTSTIKLVKE